MLICEKVFDVPDPDRPGYSFEEVDYGFSASNGVARGARRSLRKNLESGLFEVYAHSYADHGHETVAYEGDLAGALNFGNRVYGYNDAPCPHDGRKRDRAPGCPGVK